MNEANMPGNAAVSVSGILTAALMKYSIAGNNETPERM
jgi:hypothetical protein